jgi:hypothetical protein
MTEKTGLFRRLEAFEKLMVAANAEAAVAVASNTDFTCRISKSSQP